MIAALLRSSRLVMLLALALLFSFAAPRFASFENFHNLLAQAGLLALISFGMTLCMLSKGIDLSNGSTLAFAGVVGGVLLARHHMALGVLACLATGATVGLTNGLLIGWLRIPPVVATFGMFFMARGMALWVSGGAQQFGFPTSFRILGTGNFILPLHVWLAIVLFLLLASLLRGTTFGRRVYAIGVNPTAARYSGIRVESTLMKVYGLSGALAAVAAMVYMARLDSIGPDLGELFPLDAIAVSVVGGASFAGGEGGAAGTLVGALFIAMLQNGIQLLGFATHWQIFVEGAAVILGVLLNQGVASYGARRARRQEGEWSRQAETAMVHRPARSSPPS